MAYNSVRCRICGDKFRVILHSHLKKHGITTDEYRSKYPDAPIKCGFIREMSSVRAKVWCVENPEAVKVKCKKMNRSSSKWHASNKEKSLRMIRAMIKKREDDYKKYPERREATNRTLSSVTKRWYADNPEEAVKHMRVMKESREEAYRKDPVRHEAINKAIGIGVMKSWLDGKHKRQAREASKLQMYIESLLSTEVLDLVSQGILFGLPSPYNRYYFDFLVPSMKLVIEVDGCYWHGCPKCYPECGRSERDIEIDRLIPTVGWSIKRIWEHTIHEMKDDPIQILDYLLGGD